MALTRPSRRDALATLAACLADGLAPWGSTGALAQEGAATAGDRVRSEQVDALVAKHLEAYRVPGLSLAVLRDGLAVNIKGYGIANLETGAKCDGETIYNIGSVSKQFIATAVMTLVQDGKLGLDDPAHRFLKDMPEGWRGITLRHLLSHTAGLAREPPRYERSSTLTSSEHVHRAYARPLMSAPGDKFAYSNLGYFVLGEVIEAGSGQSWLPYLRARLLGPARLDRTTSNETARPGKAAGYTLRKDGSPVVAEGHVVPRPSGGIQSTVVDLGKWDRALRSDRVLSKTLRNEMWSPTRLNDGRSIPYGLGWRVRPKTRPRTVSHAGFVPGFAAMFIRQTEAKLALIVLANADSPQARLADLAAPIWNLYASIPGSPTSSRMRDFRPDPE